MSYFERLRGVLTEAGWKFEVDEEHQRMVMFASRQACRFRMDVNINPEVGSALISTYVPLLVPEHKRPAMCDLLNRINYKNFLGSVDMDWEDGEIAFRLPLAVIPKDLCPDKLDELMWIGPYMCEVYMPAFTGLMYTDISGEEAFDIIS